MGLPKPKHCCEVGSYDCQVPMPLRGRRQDVDFCVADLVAALNAANIVTTWSCCGHGKQDGGIGLEDGRELVVKGCKSASEMQDYDETVLCPECK